MSRELPPLEDRMSAQEYMTTVLHARIEELARDMTVSFRQLAEYQKHTEQALDEHFAKLEAMITTMATKADLQAVIQRLEKLEGRFDKLEERFEALDQRALLDQHTALLNRILARLEG